MDRELLSIIFGSSVLTALVPKIVSGLREWLSGRARKKRDMEKEIAEALEAERAKSFDAITAMYEALRELDKRGAPRDLIDRIEARGRGKCGPDFDAEIDGEKQ